MPTRPPVFCTTSAITPANTGAPTEVPPTTSCSADAFRYYFLRFCPFPSDGEFTWEKFATDYNAGLANNLGNLFSRVATIIATRYGGVLTGSC